MDSLLRVAAAKMAERVVQSAPLPELEDVVAVVAAVPYLLRFTSLLKRKPKTPALGEWGRTFKGCIG